MVGNGKGVYGFGVGYGNTITTARADAAMQALKRLQFVDLDSSRTLHAPVIAREYGQKCKILPLPAESGILCNRRYLPWVYIMGLHNVELKFEGELSWLSRTRAITRTTSMIMSRRTVANGEGKKYAHLMAPGDHWVHWPDRWFKEVRRRYDQKGHMIRHERRHLLHGKKRGNILVSPLEVRPGFTRFGWQPVMNKWQWHLNKRRQQFNLVKSLTTEENVLFPTPGSGRFMAPK
ncbi:30S ribosomal protein S5, putative, partial [Perkinsus marinus ATCC 50983]